MADVIRTVMVEFRAQGEGFSINDPEVGAMSVGLCGTARGVFRGGERRPCRRRRRHRPAAGGEFGCCELRKMYFLPEARGHGIGARLLSQCLRAARGFGYRVCYLETATGMTGAQGLYARAGFVRSGRPVGATGHFGCDRYFALEL